MMSKSIELSKTARVKLDGVRKSMWNNLTDKEISAIRRGSASPAECFKACRKNIKIVMNVAEKLNMNRGVFLGLEAALEAIDDSEKFIFDKYCS